MRESFRLVFWIINMLIMKNKKKLSFKVLSLYVLDYKEDPHWYDVSGYAH